MGKTATYTLLDLQQEIKSTIACNLASSIWIVAEINSLRHHSSGHCYVELVQKSDFDNKIIAQIRATIWANKVQYIQAYFEAETGRKLTIGLNVMLKVAVNYHELYGISLNITDIDPNYTIGNLEKSRKEIINRLICEGVIDMNKALHTPIVIQNIAVISSDSAAGYGDFANHLQSNNYGYKYNIKLFEATMQGENTETSVLKAFDNIAQDIEKYDVVAIIRGGGSKNDLSFFDNYNIAYMVTQFPIPVLSGIGHDRDESITDMVAHTKLKTPTAVANFLIDYNNKFECELNDTVSNIFSIAKENISAYEMYINNLTFSILKTKNILIKHNDVCNELMSKIKNSYMLRINEERLVLNMIHEKIEKSSKQIIVKVDNSIKTTENQTHKAINIFLQKENEKLNFLTQRLHLNDPKTILKRGYSISKINGKIVMPDTPIKDGDIMETHTINKIFKSRIITD